MSTRSMLALLVVTALWLTEGATEAHEGLGHHSATYEVTPSAPPPEDRPRLRLSIRDAEAGQPTAARFSLSIDGESYIPAALDGNGLRFVSIHRSRGEYRTFTFARGTGPLEIALPAGAQRGTVFAAKGYEFLPTQTSFVVDQSTASAEIRMKRCTDIAAAGWRAAEEHVHFDRTDPKHDADWLTMLAADGLTHAHFLVLKGGAVPDVWARQYAYGPEGEARDAERLIRSGEEYRDGSQGHINLLGIRRVIQPISTGGIGGLPPRANYPPLLDVLQQTHDLGGIGGPAHGGRNARSSTAVLDAVLGGADFVEIANTHLYEVDLWYRLMNCGYILPPVAGTDLPNFAFRDWWQPLLGEVRTYVQVGDRIEFAHWVRALKQGRVFVTGGPLIRFEVDGVGPGGTVELPPEGGEVEVLVRLESPRPLDSLEVVRMGQPVESSVQRRQRDGMYHWEIRQRIGFSESGWLAARGTGGPKQELERALDIQQREIAHTAAVQVLVGGRPIRSQPDLQALLQQLAQQQEYYRTEARYERTEHRQRFLALFEDAMERVQRRINE